MMNYVNSLLNRDPFVSFRLILTSGTTYEVNTPLQLVVGESVVNCLFPRSDREAVFRANQLVAVETLPD